MIKRKSGMMMKFWIDLLFEAKNKGQKKILVLCPTDEAVKNNFNSAKQFLKIAYFDEKNHKVVIGGIEISIRKTKKTR